MYPIRAATSSDLDEAVALLTRLQAEPAHHIAYHGRGAEEITAELRRIRPDWAAGTVLAIDPAGRVRGMLVADPDPERGRATLHGPFVDVPANHPAAERSWRQTADALLERVLRLPALAGGTELELSGHRRHRLLADFAARHDFQPGDRHQVFVLAGSALRAVLVHDARAPSTMDSAVRGLPADPALRAAVAALHERGFPGAPVTGAQLVAGRTGHTVVVLAGPGGLIGYAAGRARDSELAVDLVAVDPNCRSRGAGRALVRGLLRELAARHGARARAVAVTALGNDAAERMWAALGFTLDRELVVYRRKATGR
ncbi:GNAT family N-acetyltransferase [Actinophytocola sp.]|uniref:GNAT family N-acetyltransferase n=1 Tax=Actinophytocola sp. TaxID=1872138 RepID=UPI002D7EF4CC|nr:GNAT family N-acetyltransferase [Actinophytocola sp.]HET9143738.1 GNAT family N-acetyltransferase [Actinophytocola sp.]HEU5107352.1 GNAT family N-acetyltransferase [Micromonosporaceae bacterium]